MATKKDRESKARRLQQAREASARGQQADQSQSGKASLKKRAGKFLTDAVQRIRGGTTTQTGDARPLNQRVSLRDATRIGARAVGGAFNALRERVSGAGRSPSAFADPTAQRERFATNDRKNRPVPTTEEGRLARANAEARSRVRAGGGGARPPGSVLGVDTAAPDVKGRGRLATLGRGNLAAAPVIGLARAAFDTPQELQAKGTDFGIENEAAATAARTATGTLSTIGDTALLGFGEELGELTGKTLFNIFGTEDPDEIPKAELDKFRAAARAARSNVRTDLRDTRSGAEKEAALRPARELEGRLDLRIPASVRALPAGSPERAVELRRLELAGEAPGINALRGVNPETALSPGTGFIRANAGGLRKTASTEFFNAPPPEAGTAEAPSAPADTGGRQGVSARDIARANPLAAAGIIQDDADRLVATNTRDRRLALDTREADREDARLLNEIGVDRARVLREERAAQREADNALREGLFSDNDRVRRGAERELEIQGLNSEPGTFAFNTLLGRTLDNVFKNSERLFRADPLRAGGIESLRIQGGELVQVTEDGGIVPVVDLTDTDELEERGVTQGQLEFLMNIVPRDERVGLR